jgi:hypothetical protein
LFCFFFAAFFVFFCPIFFCCGCGCGAQPGIALDGRGYLRVEAPVGRKVLLAGRDVVLELYHVAERLAKLSMVAKCDLGSFLEVMESRACN